MKLLQAEESKNKNFAMPKYFRNCHCVIHDDIKVVSKYFGYSHLILLLIKTVQLVGIRNGVRLYKNAWNRQLSNLIT